MTDSSMKLTVVGCAGSFAHPESAASCYLLEAQDQAGRRWRITLDLGSGALGALQSHISVFDLDAVVLSHLHPDHFIDLTGLFVAFRYDPRGVRRTPMPVYGPAGTKDRLRAAYGTDADSLDLAYDVRDLVEGEPLTIGPFLITPRRVAHPVLAYGLRVEANGAVLTYSGDTDACESLVELAKDADVFLAEASFVEGRDVVRGVHLTGRRAGEAATGGGARRLLLTHLPVWTPADVVAAEAAEVYDGPIEVATAGMVLSLNGHE